MNAKHSLLLAPMFICISMSALDCPKQPEQMSKDSQTEVNASVAKIWRLSGAEAKVETKKTTQDLLGKLPSPDRVWLETMMYSSYCSALRDDKHLSEAEKAKRLKEYNGEVRRTINQQSSKPAKQSSHSAPTGSFDVSAPNGIAIGGGVVNNPTVNNYAPPERRLAPVARAALVSALRGRNVKIDVGALLNVPDAQQYAQDFVSALREAGITPASPYILPMTDDNASKGIVVTIHGIAYAQEKIADVPKDSPSGVLIDALTRAQITPISVHSDPNTPKDIVRLIVERN